MAKFIEGRQPIRPILGPTKRKKGKPSKKGGEDAVDHYEREGGRLGPRRGKKKKRRREEPVAGRVHRKVA